MALDLPEEFGAVESVSAHKYPIIEVAGKDWHLFQIDDETRIVASVDDTKTYYRQTVTPDNRWISTFGFRGDLKALYPDFFAYLEVVKVAQAHVLAENDLPSPYPIIEVAGAKWYLNQLDEKTRVLACVDDLSRCYHQTVNRDNRWISTFGFREDLKALYPDFFAAIGVPAVTSFTRGSVAEQLPNTLDV